MMLRRQHHCRFLLCRHSRFLSAPPPPQERVFEVTAATFRDRVLMSQSPVVLDCYASWCGPCKALTPLLKEAVERNGLATLALLDTEREQELTDSLQIKSLPTVFGVRGGRVAGQFVGAQSKEYVDDFLAKLTAGLDKMEEEPSDDPIDAAREALADISKGDVSKAEATLEAERDAIRANGKGTRRLGKEFDEKAPESRRMAQILELLGQCALRREALDDAKSYLELLKDSKRAAVLDKNPDLKARVADLSLAIQAAAAAAAPLDGDGGGDPLTAIRALFQRSPVDAIDQAIAIVADNETTSELRNAARALVVEFIDSINHTDKQTANKCRKKLANALFR